MIIRIDRRKYTSIEKGFLMIWTFFSIGYFLFALSELPYDYNVSYLYRYCANITIVLQLAFLFLIAIMRSWPRRKFIATFLFIFLVFLIEINILDRGVLVYMLFIIIAQYIDYDKFLKFDIKLKIIGLAVIIGLFVLGFTENYTASQGGVITKQSIGFSNFNQFTCFVMTILAEWLCIRYKKMRWYEWILILCFWYVTLDIGGGRTSAFTFIAIYGLFLLSTVCPRIFSSKPWGAVCTFITPLISVVTFLLVYLYSVGNSLAIALNLLFTNRLSYASRIIDSYGIKLLGQNIEFVGSRDAWINGTVSLILDNAYVRSLVYYGLIFFVLLIVMYSTLMHKLISRNRIDISLLCLFFIILGFGETYMLNAIFNTTLLCLLGSQINSGNLQSGSY